MWKPHRWGTDGRGGGKPYDLDWINYCIKGRNESNTKLGDNTDIMNFIVRRLWIVLMMERKVRRRWRKWEEEMKGGITIKVN